jgi:hypothetical protein
MAANGVMLSTKDAADRLKERYGVPVVPAAVRGWCLEGLLTHQTVGGRIIIEDEHLDGFIEGLIEQAWRRVTSVRRSRPQNNEGAGAA